MVYFEPKPLFKKIFSSVISNTTITTKVFGKWLVAKILINIPVVIEVFIGLADKLVSAVGFIVKLELFIRVGPLV